MILQVEGLRGRGRFDHVSTSETSIRSLTSYEVPTRSYIAGGRTFRVLSKTLLISALWARSRQSAGEVGGDCGYRGPPPLPPRAAYSPACRALLSAGQANSTRHWTSIPSLPPGRSDQLVVGFRLLHPGTWSFGLWQSTTGAVSEIGARMVLVPYLPG